MSKFLVSALFLSLVSASAFGQDTFCKGDRFKRAHAGVCIIDIETGKEVFSQNGEQFFVTASLQKIPLSAAAITALGPDHRFTTELSYEGTIDNEGVLHGDVWIRGGGDPTLSMDTLSEWETALKTQGVQKIDGKLRVDASRLETALASPYWYFEDLGNYYGAGPSALTINENTYRITFQPGAKQGDPAIILKTDPVIPDLIVNNEVTTGPAGSGDQVYIFGAEYSPIQHYRGTVPIDRPELTVKAAIPDPAQFCVKTFSAKIQATQGTEIVRSPPANLQIPICRKESMPVKDIIHLMNLHSVNLYAEHLLKAIGSGKGRQGRIGLEQFLKNLDIPSQVRDGSGLARTNLITPRGFAALLREIRSNPIYTSIYESFPEAGKTGTLRAFPLLTNAILRAKTGSMSNIGNLGGYIRLPSGKEYAFCLFCNNFDGPMSEIMLEMHRFLNSILGLSG